MAGVMHKFLIASMFMWILPVAILYGFNHNLLPGMNDSFFLGLQDLFCFLAQVYQFQKP